MVTSAFLRTRVGLPIQSGPQKTLHLFTNCFLLSGPPTNVEIDFFVQTFGPLDEVKMVSSELLSV